MEVGSSRLAARAGAWRREPGAGTLGLPEPALPTGGMSREALLLLLLLLLEEEEEEAGPGPSSSSAREAEPGRGDVGGPAAEKGCWLPAPQLRGAGGRALIGAVAEFTAARASWRWET
jgi:hypothetical protein